MLQHAAKGMQRKHLDNVRILKKTLIKSKCITDLRSQFKKTPKWSFSLGAALQCWRCNCTLRFFSGLPHREGQEWKCLKATDHANSHQLLKCDSHWWVPLSCHPSNFPSYFCHWDIVPRMPRMSWCHHLSSLVEPHLQEEPPGALMKYPRQQGWCKSTVWASTCPNTPKPKLTFVNIKYCTIHIHSIFDQPPAQKAPHDFRPQ